MSNRQIFDKLLTYKLDSLKSTSHHISGFPFDTIYCNEKSVIAKQIHNIHVRVRN